MKSLWLFFLLVVPVSLLSQTLHQMETEAFVHALLWNQDSLNDWFDKETLSLSHRLGIEYEEVKYKNLISYDVEDTIKEMVKSQQIGYSVAMDRLDGEYARVKIAFSPGNITRVFYFKHNLCISPFMYFARNWIVSESKLFRFIVSDSTLINPYCVERLEAFVERMSGQLGLTAQEMQKLAREKIYYYLCKDEDEIERMTGYRARGMYNLAFDAVVTTFNNHYHELLHLLINYKLHRLPLYTHPFLQEGFAVAYGGRGGMEASVLLPLGGFLYCSQFVDLPSLLEKQSFGQLDASLSYPAAGLYNLFLIETVGMTRYLRLYRKHSGSSQDQAVMHIDPSELPAENRWESYAHDPLLQKTVFPDSVLRNDRLIISSDSAIISEDGAYYHFQLSRPLLVPGERPMPHYVSKIFHGAFPDGEYKGEKYLIRANAEEISAYNLYTNNLLANYAWSFSIPPVKVPMVRGRYCFSVRKIIFDDLIGWPHR